MKPTLGLHIGHQLTMTPQLQQAIRLLQLSANDLQLEIERALETNLMLELDEQQNQELLEQTQDSQQSPFNALESVDNDDAVSSPWENWIKPTTTKINDNENQDNIIEKFNSYENTLQDHLLWQMQLTPLSETDRFIAMVIIDAINEDGFLACPFEEIINTVKQAIDADKNEVEAVLHRIQQFDPLGIASRSLEECLKIQLNHCKSPWTKKAKELLTHYLPQLAKRDYAALKRRLNVRTDELQEIIACIQQLNPRPGSLIGNSKSEYIIPDVYTYLRHGEWQVELNPVCTPQIRINDQYAGMIRRQDNSRDNQFLRDQLQEARWLIKSLENRNETLLTVAQCIVDAQQDFLILGEQAMKPLTLGQIAEQVDMHESTISRVTTQKYIYTPRGIFELKYFFSSHINTDSGIDCSSTAIRALIKKYVAHENRKKPLSDNKLAELLQKQGIKVARRTIAKYREALTIPPSNERKQPF